MEEIVFKVQGSADVPYKVSFVSSSDNNLSAYCSCPAGENGQYCKHRISILNGDTKGIVSANLDDVKTIKSWLIGTDIENALILICNLEKEAERLKHELSNAKKHLAKCMRD